MSESTGLSRFTAALRAAVSPARQVGLTRELPCPPGGYSADAVAAMQLGLAQPAAGVAVFCYHPECLLATQPRTVVPSATAPSGWTHLAIVDVHAPMNLAGVEYGSPKPSDPSHYLVATDSYTWDLYQTPGSWRYEFPNGYVASVVPDPRAPLRFEVAIAPWPSAITCPTGNRTTEQVEALLAEVAALPAPGGDLR